MGKAITAILAQDRRRRAEEAGAEVEALMKADPPLIKEAWYRLQGWYKAAVDRAPPLARATLKRVTAERVALYGAMYTPTMYHRRAPVTSWNPSTLGPNFSTASTTKCGSER